MRATFAFESFLIYHISKCQDLPPKRDSSAPRNAGRGEQGTEPFLAPMACKSSPVRVALIIDVSRSLNLGSVPPYTLEAP
jgi:hypothetical protein